jgi:transposase
MEIKLHQNATTTPRTRKYIQTSSKSDAALAEELNISIDTVRRWRNREDCYDKSHRPRTIHRKLQPEQEWLVLFLRHRLHLSLDELLEVTRLLIRADVSRAGLSRCLQKHRQERLKKPDPASGLGRMWLDALCLPAGLAASQPLLLMLTEQLTGHLSFALCAQEEREQTLSGFANYLQEELPYAINRIEVTSQLPDVQAMAARLCTQVTSTSLPVSDELIDSTIFSKSLGDILAGERFDKRLSLGAVLLEYEDILNHRVLRNRLKNLTPSAYIRQLRQTG